MGSYATLVGVEKLGRKLNRLCDRVERSIARHALREGALPMVRTIKSQVPKGKTGNLKRSIGHRAKTYQNTGIVIEVIGPRMPKGAHGHLIEFGTVDRYHERKGMLGAISRIPERLAGFKKGHHQRGLRGKFVGRMPTPTVGPVERSFKMTIAHTQRRIARVFAVDIAKFAKEMA